MPFFIHTDSDEALLEAISIAKNSQPEASFEDNSNVIDNTPVMTEKESVDAFSNKVKDMIASHTVPEPELPVFTNHTRAERNALKKLDTMREELQVISLLTTSLIDNASSAEKADAQEIILDTTESVSTRCFEELKKIKGI